MSSSSALFSPVDNLLSSIIALLRHPADPIKAIDNIMRQPKDEHGNILIALDDKNMSLWRAGLQQLVPNAIFKPIVIVTNPDVIKVLLNELKSDSDSIFAGNPSTDTIGKLVGIDNIFASSNKSTHDVHKLAFKNYLSDMQQNIELVAPIIKAWVMAISPRVLNDEDFELLAASVMLTFLLDRKFACESQFVADIITLKQHFVRTATLSDGFKRFFDGYEGAKKRLINAITECYNSDKPSYIKTLSTQFDLPQTISHILSLMMVGFDNLRSSLISTVMQLAKHPEYRTILAQELQNDGKGTAFLNFELMRRGTASSEYFARAMQHTPPVWLQARVSKAESLIKYSDANGEHTFKLPTSALVLIPNLHLALLQRQEARRSAELFPHPFSMGPNACPGRPIAYAANGILIATLINQNIRLGLSPNSKVDYDPKVALSLKDLHIYVGYSDEGMRKLVEIEKNPSLKCLMSISMFSAASGLLATLLSDYHKNSVPASILIGVLALTVTLLLSVDLLVAEEERLRNSGADVQPDSLRLR